MTDTTETPAPPEPALVITPEELMRLPVRRYEGAVKLISTAAELAEALRELRDEEVIGFDTETRPSFRKGESYLPSLAQLAGSRAVYLLPLKKLDCSETLAELLQHKRILKAGIGLRDDFTKLRMRFSFEEKSFVELSDAAKKQGMGQPSARNLTALFLGFRITKGQSTSNWGRSELTPQQIHYAATDAWICRELYFCFREKGFALEPRDYTPPLPKKTSPRPGEKK